MPLAALPPALPPQSAPHLPVLAREASRLQSPVPAFIMAGQVDHDTACPDRKKGPKKCWNPTVEFKTSREQGVGLGQITRVFGRFDALAEMRAAHRAELAGWSWENVGDATYQLRALVLKNRDNHRALSPLFDDPLYPVLTAYNRGVGGIRADRRLCQVTKGCDADRWAGHVEQACAGGTAVIPGTRLTACQISRKYAPDVVARAGKYRGKV